MKHDDENNEQDIIQDIEKLDRLKFIEDDFFFEINELEVSDGIIFKFEELARAHDKLVYKVKLTFADFYSKNYHRLVSHLEETETGIEDGVQGEHVSGDEKEMSGGFNMS